MNAPVRSLAYKWWEKAKAENMTIRQFYTRACRWRRLPADSATAAQIADGIEEWVEQGGADGFNVTPTHLPHGIDDFVELVVPELQRRGLFRTEYEGATLRENLGPRPLCQPVGARARPPDRGRYPPETPVDGARRRSRNQPVCAIRRDLLRRAGMSVPCAAAAGRVQHQALARRMICVPLLRSAAPDARPT
ncbi:MAG: hypothetical protein WDN49_11705 [Acetobacteraceae bacterium]